MSHQIDTVHWFSGLQHPRSVVANGGIYMWKDGQKKLGYHLLLFLITVLSMILSNGFQVTFSSRMHNGDENPAEIYYSNGGELNLKHQQSFSKRRTYKKLLRHEHAAKPVARNEFVGS